MPSEQPDWRRSLRKMPAPLLEEPVTINTEFVAHSRVEGRLDAVQLQFQTVGDRHYLYAGHIWSYGVSILDVTNPADPQVAAFIESPNESTKHTKVQVADGIAMLGCEAPMFDPRPDPTQGRPRGPVLRRQGPDQSQRAVVLGFGPAGLRGTQVMVERGPVRLPLPRCCRRGLHVRRSARSHPDHDHPRHL